MSTDEQGTHAPSTLAGASDAVARYCDASAANDIDALMATLSPRAELVSPLSGRMVFSARQDIRQLAAAVYGTLRGMHWGEQIGDGAQRAVVAECRVGPLRLHDAMIFELDEDGLIVRVRPHLRPWLATTLFALMLGPKLAPRPGLLLRALRGRERYSVPIRSTGQ